MQKAKQRYTLTDTGHLAELLDAAQERWPEIVDRKELLLRLVEEGHAAHADGHERPGAKERQARINRAIERIPSLVDREP